MDLRFRPDLKPGIDRFLPGALKNQAKSKIKTISDLGRFPSAYGEVMGTNGFTALWKGARGRYNRARRRKGDSIPERCSFHKGLALLCTDKYDKGL